MKLIIQKKLLQENIEHFRKHIGLNVKLMAIVKADAYGHGMVGISKEIETKVDAFGVSTIDEAVMLREAEIQKDILVLGPSIAFEEAIAHNLILTIEAYDQFERLICYVKKEKKTSDKIRVHLKVDTGMHRFGLGKNALLDVIHTIVSLTEEISFEGVYSHLATTFLQNENAVRRQKATFDQIKQSVEKIWGGSLIWHLENSENAIDFPDGHYDMVRIGNGLYGPCNSRKKLGLKKIAKVMTTIVSMHPLAKGEKVGYGLHYKTKKDTIIGVVEGGIYEGIGLTRLGIGLSQKAYLKMSIKQMLKMLRPNNKWIVGKKNYPIVGPMNMQYTLIDLGTSLEQVGDEVEVVQAPLYLKESIRKEYI